MNPDAEKRFEQWKQDLEERLAKHLFEHPEQSPSSPEPVKTTPTALYAEKWIGEKARHGDKVYVVESASAPGAWRVFKNGQSIVTFFGGDAYGRASVFAAQLLQD